MRSQGSTMIKREEKVEKEEFNPFESVKKEEESSVK